MRVLGLIVAIVVLAGCADDGASRTIAPSTNPADTAPSAIVTTASTPPPATTGMPPTTRAETTPSTTTTSTSSSVPDPEPDPSPGSETIGVTDSVTIRIIDPEDG